MKRILVSLLVIAGVPLLASGATYGLYGMSVEHASQDGTGTLYGMNVVGTGINNSSGGNFIGQFRLTFLDTLPGPADPSVPSATPPPGYGVIGSSFTAFCMELDVAIGIADKGKDVATYSFSMTDTVPQNNRAYAPRPWLNGPQQASYLYNTYGSMIHDTGLTDLERNVAAAALQAAIWTSLYGEEVYNVSGTAEQLEVYSLWFAYLHDTSWTNQSYNSSWWQGTDLDGTIQQGLIGPRIVPEPKETGILCGLFLTGLLGWEIRRRTIQSAQRPP